MNKVQEFIKLLRKKYPNPVTYDAWEFVAAFAESRTMYCVGGAFCCETIKNEEEYRCLIGVDEEMTDYQTMRFPNETDLATALMSANSSLTFGDALEFAESLIMQNDNSQFDKAFRILEKALSHVGEENGSEDSSREGKGEVQAAS